MVHLPLINIYDLFKIYYTDFIYIFTLKITNRPEDKVWIFKTPIDTFIKKASMFVTRGSGKTLMENTKLLLYP